METEVFSLSMQTKLDFRIRRSDLSEIVKFEEWLKKSLPYLSKKITEDYLKKRIEKVGRGKLIEVVSKRSTVGFIAWFEETSEKAYLWLLLVSPRYRNLGIGGHLLDIALEEIKRNGYQRVWAKVKNDNRAVLSLLLKRDFFIKGLVNEEGLSTVLVEKTLESLDKRVTSDPFIVM